MKTIILLLITGIAGICLSACETSGQTKMGPTSGIKSESVHSGNSGGPSEAQ